MAGQYVFPGGRIHPSDRRRWLSEPDPAGFEHRPWLLALARAALRETFEETGLLIGRRSTALPQRAPHDHMLTPIEAAYQAERLAPAVDRLMAIGRAITPGASPIRFHAHFFMSDAELAVGALRGGDELEDLRWHSVDGGELPQMADVTRFMLTQAAIAWRHGTADSVPLYSYVRGIPKVTWRERSPRPHKKEGIAK